MSVNLRTVYAFAREMYRKDPKLGDIQYGTAGFREKADKLEYVMYRMGLLATLRSRLKKGQAIGVMVTASHNPEPDNGVKLIDPQGEMLEKRWEAIATNLVNVSDNELQEAVSNIIETENIDNGSASTVLIGMDNRYHSRGLLEAVKAGVVALKGKVISFEIITTPMLHYFVVCANTNGAYGTATEEGYYTKLIDAFKKLRGDQLDNGNYKNALIFDGANGVGGRKMLQFIKRLGSSLNVEVYNKGEGKINEKCGADHVKVIQQPPQGLPKLQPYTRCVSVDGDADRVIYFFIDDQEKCHLLDGDRIATLFASYLIGLVRLCKIDLSLGLVQTAYANGASTDYIKNKLEVPVECVSTGVKHLHHKAIEYDIGIYFEANGHGTIVFSSHAKKVIADVINRNDATEEQVVTAKNLLLIIDLINETVGDAISDSLFVEVILQKYGWDVQDWLACYSDLPNLQRKVSVPDRSIITTTDAERKCITPVGLQKEIDQAVSRYPKGRSFVRPSGTEDIVRVYAEAETAEDTEKLANEVCAIVNRFATEIESTNK